MPRSLLPLLLLASCAAPAAQGRRVEEPEGWQRNVMVVYGVRNLQEQADWEPVDQQQVVGLELDFYDPQAWYRSDRDIGYEIGLSQSWDDGSVDVPGVGSIDVSAQTTELSFGGRLTFHAFDRRLHPYLGTGLSLLRAEADPASGATGKAEDDFGFGAYVRGGVYWSPTKALRLGFDYRWLLFSSVDVGVDTDVDYQQLGLLVGWGF